MASGAVGRSGAEQSRLVKSISGPSLPVSISVPDRVRLTVQDNGKGKTDGDGADRDGLGLTGMRERVTALEGEFTVDGQGGTSVTITLPLVQRSGGPTRSDQSPSTLGDPEPCGAKR